jgi:type I restriction enzyme R subunit
VTHGSGGPAPSSHQKAFTQFYETTLTEPTDPNLLYGMQQEVESYRLLVPAEMTGFVQAYLELPAVAKERAHAALYHWTDPAKDRFAALLEDDPERAESFRSALRGYARAYAFIAAVIAWYDPDLERLYLFGRSLLLRLARRSDPAVDVGQVQLTHLRIARTGETDASLGAGQGNQMLPGFTGVGIAGLPEKNREALSAIIKRLNEKFGHELTDADTLAIEQHVVSATEDKDLRAAAKANTLENYGYVFDPRFEGLMLDRHEANAELLHRFLDNPEVNQVFTAWAREESYRRIRDT